MMPLWAKLAVLAYGVGLWGFMLFLVSRSKYLMPPGDWMYEP